MWKLNNPNLYQSAYPEIETERRGNKCLILLLIKLTPFLPSLCYKHSDCLNWSCSQGVFEPQAMQLHIFSIFTLMSLPNKIYFTATTSTSIIRKRNFLQSTLVESNRSICFSLNYLVLLFASRHFNNFSFSLRFAYPGKCHVMLSENSAK